MFHLPTESHFIVPFEQTFPYDVEQVAYDFGMEIASMVSLRPSRCESTCFARLLLSQASTL